MKALFGFHCHDQVLETRKKCVLNRQTMLPPAEQPILHGVVWIGRRLIASSSKWPMTLDGFDQRYCCCYRHHHHYRSVQVVVCLFDARRLDKQWPQVKFVWYNFSCTAYPTRRSIKYKDVCKIIPTAFAYRC